MRRMQNDKKERKEKNAATLYKWDGIISRMAIKYNNIQQRHAIDFF